MTHDSAFLALIGDALAKCTTTMALWRDRPTDDPIGARLHLAISKAISGRLDAEERAWVNRIENMRTMLLSDNTEINKIDYGARKPNSVRTTQEGNDGLRRIDTISRICAGASKSPFWSRVLFEVVREFQPSNGVELGTCLGISAAYQAGAQKLNASGRFVTLEGDPTLGSLAAHYLKEIGLADVAVVVGRFQDVLPDLLMHSRPIDYVFIDGHHDERATLSYFEIFLPHLAPMALIVFDDIAWSPGMRRAWRLILGHRRVSVNIDLRQIGICVVGASGLLDNGLGWSV